MNSFKNAYASSRQSVNEDRRREIDRQHAVIVNAVKEEYGIDSFSDLGEKERASYKSMILEMWDPKTGITRKGEAFLNEGRRVITADSTDAELKSHFQKKVVSFVRSFIQGNRSKESLFVEVCGVKSSMESETGKKLASLDVKKWLGEVLGGEAIKVAKEIKF